MRLRLFDNCETNANGKGTGGTFGPNAASTFCDGHQAEFCCTHIRRPSGSIRSRELTQNMFVTMHVTELVRIELSNI